MKKTLYTLVITSLILFNAVAVKASNEVYYTNNNGIEMTEGEYNNLLELAFTEEQIARMDYQTFIDNKDIEGTLLSSETYYVQTTTTLRNGIRTYQTTILGEDEFSELEMMQSLEPTYSPNLSGNFYDGLTWTSIKCVTSYITGLNDTYMRYKADMYWVTMPSEQHWDIFGIGIEPSKVHVASTVIFREDYKTTSGTIGYDETYCEHTESSGGAALFQLPSQSLSKLEATVYFNVAKNSGVGTVTSLYAYAAYAHGHGPVDYNNVLSNISIASGGINVGGTYGYLYYNESPTVAVFIGSW